MKVGMKINCIDYQHLINMEVLRIYIELVDRVLAAALFSSKRLKTEDSKVFLNIIQHLLHSLMNVFDLDKSCSSMNGRVEAVIGDIRFLSIYQSLSNFVKMRDRS